MMTDYDKFRKEVLKVNNSRKITISNSYTTEDAYHWLCKKKIISRKKVSQPKFRIIINTLNKYLQESFLNGHTITFPRGLGILEVVKYPLKISFKNGKLSGNFLIDWQKTLHFWHEDPEAMKTKTTIKHEAPMIYRIFYRFGKAGYKNKKYFLFTPTRTLKNKLTERIKNNTFDTVILSKPYELYTNTSPDGQNNKTSSYGGHSF